MMSPALRTSFARCGVLPPSTKTLLIAGRLCKRAAIASVNFSVSDSCDPGGNSIASTDRAESCAGKKRLESSSTLQMDIAKSNNPAKTVT
jgi:hypothetical protein